MITPNDAQGKKKTIEYMFLLYDPHAYNIVYVRSTYVLTPGSSGSCLGFSLEKPNIMGM